MAVAFPTGTPDITAARTSKVLGDNGSQGGNVTVSQLFSLIQLTDIFTQLMSANDVVEDVAAATTTYSVVAGDKNKTKRFLSTGNCLVNLPNGMPIGFLLDTIQDGLGILTFQSAPGASQTLVAPRGARSGGPAGVRVTVQVTALNTWNVSGDTQV